jgi:ribosomal protein S18 acetylase RimI-like enzyme
MITISKAKVNECQKIRQLEQLVWNDKNITSKFDAPTFVKYGYTYVAKDKNKIIGAIISIVTPKNELKIIDWIVDKQYRGKGIGEKLFNKLFDLNMPIVSQVNAKNKISLEGHKKIGFKLKKKIKDAYYIGEKQMYYILERN